MEEGEHMRRYSRFVWAMYYLRTRFPTMSVTSWGRSILHNRTLPGSVPDSLHLEWCAVDLTWDPGMQPDLGAFQAAARQVGMKVIREKDHDHLEQAGDFPPLEADHV